MKKKIVIVGATSTIAEHCIKLWCQPEAELLLIARNSDRLQELEAHFKIYCPAAVIHSITDNFVRAIDVARVINEVHQVFGVPDIVLIAHGALIDQTDAENNSTLCEDSLLINGVSPVLILNAFANLMKDTGGTIAVIGSVAGDRGRKSNYIYGAAKSLIETAIDGMQHRFFSHNLKIILVKPGPTDTRMTVHLKETGMALANPEDVARDIVDGINKGRNVIYTPKKWFYIMFIIRLLPKFIFNRLNI